MLLEGEASQETVPQAAGESSQLSVLSGLVNSLSSLIWSLAPRVSDNLPVKTVTSAPSYPVNPSAAAVSDSPGVHIFAQPAPDPVATVGIQKELQGPGTL